MLLSRPVVTGVVAGLLVLVSGCGALTNNELIGGENAVLRDRAQDYEASEVAKGLVIPAHLDSDKIRELLVVPEIGIAATISDTAFEIPRPDFFVAEAGNDKVNLARDGQERLIVVNEPLTQVWDKLQAFFASNNQQIVVTDPAQGLLETAWIDSGESQPGLFSRLVANLTFRALQGPAQDKLRAYLQAIDGDSNKTSIRLRHLRARVTDSRQAPDWSKDAQDVDYKSQVMYELLHYLSLSTEQSTASAARERQKQQGRVYFGRSSEGEPVLKLTSSVDEAWERIAQALTRAQVDVGSADKDLGKYYISFSSAVAAKSEKSVGFFTWLHGEREEIRFDTGSLGAALGVESDTLEPVYSAKTAVVENLSAEQTAAVEQQQLQDSEGYKIWLGDKVIYAFGGAQDARLKKDQDSGALTFTDRYQVKLNRRSSGIYVSILTAAGEPAVSVVAEDILWTLKENMPAN